MTELLLCAVGEGGEVTVAGERDSDCEPVIPLEARVGTRKEMKGRKQSQRLQSWPSAEMMLEYDGDKVERLLRSPVPVLTPLAPSLVHTLSNVSYNDLFS